MNGMLEEPSANVSIRIEGFSIFSSSMSISPLIAFQMATFTFIWSALKNGESVSPALKSLISAQELKIERFTDLAFNWNPILSPTSGNRMEQMKYELVKKRYATDAKAIRRIAENEIILVFLPNLISENPYKVQVYRNSINIVA